MRRIAISVAQSKMRSQSLNLELERQSPNLSQLAALLQHIWLLAVLPYHTGWWLGSRFKKWLAHHSSVSTEITKVTSSFTLFLKQSQCQTNHSQESSAKLTLNIKLIAAKIVITCWSLTSHQNFCLSYRPVCQLSLFGTDNLVILSNWWWKLSRALKRR